MGPGAVIAQVIGVLIGVHVLVFFLPKDARTQRKRLIGRQRETVEQIEERIKQAITDAEYAIHYDYVIVNENLDDTLKDMQLIVKDKEAACGGPPTITHAARI